MEKVGEALQALGFTEIEALAYCLLLQSGPATGYRVAQGIGKASANTYQALATLEQRGAVSREASGAKLYRAEPPDQLLAALARSFEARRTSAQAALSQMAQASADDRVYRLRTVDQVYARADELIAGARTTVLVDAFPTPLAQLMPELRAAIKRDVAVACLVYDDEFELKGATVVRMLNPKPIFGWWPGDNLLVTADAASFLTALLTRDGHGVTQALASDSAFLSCLQHNWILGEMRAAHFETLLGKRDALGERLRMLSLANRRPAGWRQLTGAKPDE